MNQLFVGIDVGSRDNAVYIMLPDGSKHSSFAVQNNLGGAQALSKRVVSALREQELKDVLLGLEATSVYGDNLVCFLREDCALAGFNRKVHVLNPKQVKKFKSAYSDLPKNDAVPSSLRTTSALDVSVRRSTWTTIAIRLCKTLPERVSLPFKA